MPARESQHVLKKELKVINTKAKYLTQCTRLQPQSMVWFKYRKGRLTESRFRAICCTSVDKPAKSLVVPTSPEKIDCKKCCPNMGLLRSQWPDWSMRVMKISHTSFKVELSTTHEPTILRFCVLDTSGYSYGERILYTVQLKKNLLQLLTVTNLFSTERYL